MALFIGSASSSLYLQCSCLQQFFVGRYAEVWAFEQWYKW